MKMNDLGAQKMVSRSNCYFSSDCCNMFNVLFIHKHNTAPNDTESTTHEQQTDNKEPNASNDYQQQTQSSDINTQINNAKEK